MTVEAVEEWVFGLAVRPKTMHGYLGDVKTLLNHFARRGRVPGALVASLNSIDLPESDTRPRCAGGPAPGCECLTVLEHCRAANLDVMRHLAVRYFAGVALGGSAPAPGREHPDRSRRD